MGCASWRAHDRVREHAEVAPASSVIRGSRRRPPQTSQSAVLGLNEVGVTDAIMATLWRFGPSAAAFAVSPGAEANHVGADIAIVHSAKKRVLLYQAKLGQLQNDDAFHLKTAVGAKQVRMLTRQRVTLDKRNYRITGRIAVYQADSTPFIARCNGPFPYLWGDEHFLGPYSLGRSRQPQVARWYYEEVLVGRRCSPSGILAAAVAGTTPVARVPARSTWPWEFDAYEWMRRSSPLDRIRGAGSADRPMNESEARLDERAPDFDEYSPVAAEPPSPEATAGMARQLAERLNLGSRAQLFVIQI